MAKGDRLAVVGDLAAEGCEVCDGAETPLAGDQRHDYIWRLSCMGCLPEDDRVEEPSLSDPICELVQAGGVEEAALAVRTDYYIGD